MNVSEAVGAALVRCGVGQVFGVVGSGNFAVTNAMVAAGARFVAAPHQGGGGSVAAANPRASRGVAGVTLHHRGGLTNPMT
ncbi:thiamine pyrophosphate-binding protein, partial [Blastococcus sp. SYSU D00669]